MTSADVRPATEDDRLAVVAALRAAESPSEERFDRIARVAAALFDVPVAAVTLLDADQLWFKACLGLDTRSAPREDAFCSRAVTSRATLVVPDLTKDDVFRSNPYVTGAGIRFYAGQPLEVHGQVVGTLCLMDRRPRDLTDSELDRLRDLAHWAASELGTVELAEVLRRELAATEALRLLKRRDELTLELAETAIFGVDTSGRVTFANRAVGRLLRVDAASLVGVDFHAAHHHTAADGEPYPWEQCPTRAAVRDLRPQRVPVELVHRADGTAVEVEYAAAPVVVDGTVTGVVVTLVDISERRAVERLKDEFVSVVSHELRTPLTSIRGSLGLLARGSFGDLPAQAERLVDIALSNTERLARLVNDILDLDRMEAGRLELTRTPQPLAPLLEAARDAVAGAAQTAGVLLEVRPTDLFADVDGDLVVRAVVNLLGNAVKFSPPDEAVEVRAERLGDCVHVTVTDRGRGIPAEQLGSVFERFQQVDASDAREKGGTGLGLPITRSIAELHGGRVDVASEPGRGSVFTLVLPAADRDGSTDGSGAVVVVEDDADLAEVLVAALQVLGVAVTTESGAAAGVATIRRLRPRLVVLDVTLADGSGFEVVERLRQDPATAATPVVVTTVQDLDAEARRRLVLGPTSFVRKGGSGADAVEGVVEAVRAALGLG